MECDDEPVKFLESYNNDFISNELMNFLGSNMLSDQKENIWAKKYEDIGSKNLWAQGSSNDVNNNIF